MISNTQLSTHISFYDLTTTSKMDKQELNREKGLAKVEVLKTLASVWLQPIRDHYNKPIIISSGFRSIDLNNDVVGAVATSQHQLGQAADFIIKGVSPLEVFHWLWKESPNCFYQLIYETTSDRKLWIHYGIGYPFKPIEQCGQVFMFLDHKKLDYTKVDWKLENGKPVRS